MLLESQQLDLQKNICKDEKKKKKHRRKKPYSSVGKAENYRKGLIPYTQQFNLSEDRLILESVLRMGPRFKEITQLFPKHELNAVKNRYYKILRYQWKSIMGKDLETLRQEMKSNIITQADLFEYITIFSPEIQSILTKIIDGIHQFSNFNF